MILQQLYGGAMVIFDKCKICRKQFNYILCEKQRKVSMSFLLKNAIVCDICHVFMVDIKILYCLNYFNKEIAFAIEWLVHR